MNTLYLQKYTDPPQIVRDRVLKFDKVERVTISEQGKHFYISKSDIFVSNNLVKQMVLLDNDSKEKIRRMIHWNVKHGNDMVSRDNILD